MPCVKKPKLSTEDVQVRINTSFCSTKSRESTPELDLWSDDEENDNEEKPDKPSNHEEKADKFSDAQEKAKSSSDMRLANYAKIIPDSYLKEYELEKEPLDFDSDNEDDVKLNSFFHSTDGATSLNNENNTKTQPQSETRKSKSLNYEVNSTQSKEIISTVGSPITAVNGGRFHIKVDTVDADNTPGAVKDTPEDDSDATDFDEDVFQ